MTVRIAAVLVAVAAALAFFAAAPAVARQGASPTAEATPDENELPPLPGQIAEAEREYRATEGRLTGTAQLLFGVGEFDTEEAAAAGIPALAERIRTDPDTANVPEVGGPTFGDESLAFSGEVDLDGTDVFVAYLAFRDGRFVHAWLGASLDADPLPDLLSLAERTMGGPGTPAAGTPESGTPDPISLLDRLPGLTDLPPGFVLVDESLETYNGAATPVATPAT